MQHKLPDIAAKCTKCNITVLIIRTYTSSLNEERITSCDLITDTLHAHKMTAKNAYSMMHGEGNTNQKTGNNCHLLGTNKWCLVKCETFCMWWLTVTLQGMHINIGIKVFFGSSVIAIEEKREVLLCSTNY